MMFFKVSAIESNLLFIEHPGSVTAAAFRDNMQL
jgi:hypothetical protein